MLSIKDCINFLNNKTEFSGLSESQVRYKNIVATRTTALLFNQDWIDFTTLSAINKVSDAQSRFVYYGSLSVLADGAILTFSYRGNQSYIGNASLESYLTQQWFLFDKTIIIAGAVALSWQFTGFIIDRGA